MDHKKSKLGAFNRKVKGLIWVLAGGQLLGFPGAVFPATPVSISEVVASVRQEIEKNPKTESLERATKALDYMSRMDLRQASRYINEALQLDARNSYLHFFNGLIYHLQAKQGETDKADTAIEGYQQAIRFDPSNSIAHEFLGLVYLEQRQFIKAQSEFAEVLLNYPTDIDVLQRMMAASYMANDASLACVSADRIRALSKDPGEVFLKSSAVVYAACNKFDQAREQIGLLPRAGVSASEITRLEQRIANWADFHQSAKQASRSRAEDSDMPPRDKVAAELATKTQFGQLSGGFGAGAPSGAFGGASTGMDSSGGFGGQAGGFGSQSGGFGSQPGGFGGGGFGGQPGGFGGGGFGGAPGGSGMFPGGAPGQMPGGAGRMVLVDVVLVRTEDTITTSRGVNLLGALNLQFGALSGQTPAMSRVFTDNGSGGSTVLTRTVTVPALSYSLNIANANSNLNEVLARPTLAAVEGMKSEFFSGTALNAAVVSAGSAMGGGGAVTIEKKYGVKLGILPQILPDGMIRLQIEASRTFLKPPSSNIGYTYKLEISEILANANVVMRLGDTLVLGGLSEKETTNARDGVPILQDIPALQYLFSNQNRTDYQKSVLMLITPRPASYTWMSEETKKAIAQKPDDPFTPSLDVLRARYSDWFKPYPNMASVFHHLNSADLYREFRTGDVKLESWERMDSTKSRLKQALGYLYY